MTSEKIILLIKKIHIMNEVKATYEFHSHTIAFEHVKNGANLTAIYIHGFGSHPWERTAESIKTSVLALEMNFFRFELVGHGSDSATLSNGNYYLWIEQILDVIDHKIEGDILLIAHSIGAGIGIIAASRRPERFKGIITAAIALNAAEIVGCRMQKNDWHSLYREKKIKTLWFKFPFTFTKEFMLSGLENHVSSKELKTIACPIFLLHGTQDTFIPTETSIKVSHYVSSEKNVVIFIESGHHFRDKKALSSLKSAIEAMYSTIKQGGS